jgi:hypothetical protein
MRFLLVLACASLSVAGSLFAQSRPEQVPAGGQVEVKTDRFSGVTTVSLKQTDLFKKPDHRLAIALQIRLDPRKGDEEAVLTRFFSYSESAILFGDMEIHCLVDEKPLSLGKARHGQRGVLPGSPNEINAVIGLQNFEKIADGKKVEMRLGSVEWVFPNQSLLAIREFVSTAKKQRESFKTQEKKNEK